MIYNDIHALKAQVDQWKSEGLKVVFTNGVFDILHIGHVDYLQKSKALGHKLIIGINDDNSVRRLNKGPERPIHPELARAGVIDALRCVDAVIIFGDDTPLELISTLLPNVLVKGGDYDPNEMDESKKTYMVGSKEVRAIGGHVYSIPLVAGFSTSEAVRKIKNQE